MFYEHNQVANLFLQIFIVFPPLIVTISLATKFKLISSVSKAEKNEEIIKLWNRLGKFRLAVIAVYVIVLFCLISSVNVVYNDKIVTKSVFNLKGTEYSYEQVEEIKCGFGDSSFSVLNYKEKGSFYYQIKLNGKFITFYQPTVNADNEVLANAIEQSFLESTIVKSCCK